MRAGFPVVENSKRAKRAKDDDDDDDDSEDADEDEDDRKKSKYESRHPQSSCRSGTVTFWSHGNVHRDLRRIGKQRVSSSRQQASKHRQQAAPSKQRPAGSQRAASE